MTDTTTTHPTGHWGRVQITDFLPPMRAFIDSRRWNGWACPHLPRESVEALMRDLATDHANEIRLEWDGDDVLMHELNAADEPGYSPQRYTPTVIDGGADVAGGRLGVGLDQGRGRAGMNDYDQRLTAEQVQTLLDLADAGWTDEQLGRVFVGLLEEQRNATTKGA